MCLFAGEHSSPLRDVEDVVPYDTPMILKYIAVFHNFVRLSAGRRGRCPLRRAKGFCIFSLLPLEKAMFLQYLSEQGVFPRGRAKAREEGANIAFFQGFLPLSAGERSSPLRDVEDAVPYGGKEFIEEASP